MGIQSYDDFLYGYIRTLPGNDAMHALYAKTHNELLRNNHFEKLVDLDTQKQKERYNKYIEFILSKHFKTPGFESFSTLDYKTIIELFIYIISKVFENAEPIKEELTVFLSSIQMNGSNEVLDGYSTEAHNTITGEKTRVILVPNLDYTASVICLCHEFIHFHLRYNNKEDKIFEYGEILSILMEKISSYLLQDIVSDNNIESNIEKVRMDAIQWHYGENKQMVEMNRRLLSQIPDENFHRMFNEEVIYATAVAQSYGIGNLYAENLMHFYLEDSKKLIAHLAPILYDGERVHQLLEYYGISTSNQETFNRAKVRTRTLIK